MSDTSSTVPWVHVPGAQGGGDERYLGGKGASLCELMEAGFPVPPFFCVTTRALNETLGPLRREISARLGTLGELDPADPGVAERIRELAEKTRVGAREEGLGDAASEAIDAAFRACFEPDARVAIRSSVVGEDSVRDSFAGQMETWLFVGREDVSRRVLDCLLSAFSERALLYRHARGLLDRPVEAAVVVQEMVSAERSGVAFTVDPVRGDPSEIVISAGFGLGEGVVSDRVEVDTFRVDKTDGTVRAREIVTKEHQVVWDGSRGEGTRVEQVPEARREEPVLSDPELAAVTELARRLETWGKAPCDVEWSLEPGGTLRLLQSRPITGLSDERLTILDNSNIVESYPGISSPLTFSFVREGYAETFREAMRTFGVSEAVLDREQALFENLVAWVDGRIYYNILKWYGLYDLMGLESGIPAWEEALGLSRGARREWRVQGPGLWRKAYIRARLVAHLFVRRGRIDEYLEALRDEEAKLGARDLESLEPHDLVELLEDVSDRLLAPYGIAVVNDLYAQQLYGLVGRLIERWQIGDPDALRNALVAGGAPSDSVRPVRSLMELADQIREDPEWREFFERESDPEALWDELRRRPELADLRGRVEEHLNRYGDRTVHELKLETPSLREDPAFALGHLRSWVVGPRMEPHADPGSLRDEAESRVRDHLRFRPLRRAVFFWLLRRTRDAIRYRENLRMARTRAFGLVKRIFGALASRFSDRGLLAHRRDIFFLTVEEIKGAVRGHSLSPDLREVVALRRDQRARYEQSDPPPRIVTRGPVQSVSMSRRRRGLAGSLADELQGQGCSRGVVRGRAVVVREPRRRVDVRGKILIAPMTDPGWVFLMVAARGLVVEKGSMLSHTAIVGRELGIPTVVSVEEATRHVRDGDLVEIDGSGGTVRILERASEGRVSDREARSG